MKVGIFINTTKQEANTVANKFSKLLIENSIESKVVNMKEDCRDIDLIAVFGGDGTILRVVRYAIEYNIPILAINIGQVGFLSCCEANQLDEALQLIKSSNDFDKRSVIKTIINGEKYYALNEVCVQRYMEGHSLNEVVNLSLSIDGYKVDEYNADGLIIATPTGSTAYSLSAGGSIMTPDISAFIATPVCSHSLHSRPIVFADNKLARVTVLQRSPKCSVFIDGKLIKNISAGDSVDIQKSKHTVRFYKTNDNFFEKLLIKLNSWSYIK